MKSLFNGFQRFTSRLRKLFAGSATIALRSRRFSRRTNRPRLGVECLEERVVMSGGVTPGYLLTNGNLYNTAISQTQPIDTGVKNFAVDHDKVVDLHSGTGLLETMNSDGSGKVVVNSGITSFAIDGSGDVMYLYLPTGSSKGGNLYQYNPTTGFNGDILWLHATANYAIDGAGDTVALDDNGNVNRYKPNSIYASVICDSVTSFVVDGSGSVITFSQPTGSLNRFAPGAGADQRQNISYPDATLHIFTQYALDGAGSVVELDTKGNLYRDLGSINASVICDSVTSFVVDGSGSVITFSQPTGSLNRFAPGAGADQRQNISYPDATLHIFTQYALDGAGSVVELDTKGNLYRDLGSINASVICDSVTSFVVDKSGSVITFSQPTGSLNRFAPGAGADQRQNLSYPDSTLHTFTSYALDGAGALVALDKGGNLYRYAPGSIYASLLDSGVISFVVDGAGSVVEFVQGGGLNRFTEGGNPYQNGNISYPDSTLHTFTSYALDGAGALVALDKGGNLYRYAPGSIYASLLDSGVISFVVDGAGSVVEFVQGGGLNRFTEGGNPYQNGNISYPDSTLHTFTSYALDGAGALVALDKGGNLYRYAPGSIYASLLDSGVISFVVDGAGSVVEFVQGGGLNRFTEGGNPYQNGNISYPDSTLHTFTSYALDGAGALVALDKGGNLYRYAPGSIYASLLDSGVISFVVDGAGSVVEFVQGGGLNRFTEGGNPYQNGNISYPDSTLHTFTSYALDGAGALVALDKGGNLYRYAPGSIYASLLDSGVISFVVDGAGSVVEFVQGGGLNRFTEGGNPYQNGNISYPDSTLHTFTSYALDGAGALVALDKGGNLYRYAPGSIYASLLDSGVISFVVDGAGSVVEFVQGGGLNRFTEGGNPYQNGNISYPDSTLHTFTSYALDGAGALVALDKGGNLYRYAPGSIYASLLDSGVISFVVDGAGSVVAMEQGTTAASVTGLQQGGHLVRVAPGGNSALLISGWTAVTSYGLDGSGSVLALFQDGSLRRFAPGANDPSNPINGSPVVSFVVDGAGSVVAMEQGTTAALVTNLQQGGHLVRVASGGNSALLISGWTAVTSYALDGSGSVVVLFQDGSLRRFAPGANGPSNPINDSPVVSFVVDGSGSVVAMEQGTAAGSVAGLQQGGHLVRYAPGANTPLLISGWTAVSSYGLDGSGSVLALFQDGSLRRFAPGANGPSNPVVISAQSFGFRSDGILYVVHTNNDVTIDTPTGQQIGDFGVVQNFAIGPDGSGYVLQNGNLTRNTPSQNLPIDGSVSSFGFRSDGILYVLHTNNDVTIDTPTGQQIGDFGVVQDFAIGPDGSGYVLQNGNLTYNTPSQNLPIDGSVSSFGFRSDGILYVLHTNNDVTIDTPAGQQIGDLGVVQDFAIGPDGSGYVLQNGNLTRNTPSQNLPIDGSVSSFGFRSDGILYVLHTNNDLTLDSSTGQQIGPGFGVVQQFVVGPDGSGYLLQNGNLFRNTPSQNLAIPGPGINIAWFNISIGGEILAYTQVAGQPVGQLQTLSANGTWSMIDSNIVQWSPGHDGSFFAVDADTSMWQEVDGAQGWTRNWVDANVRSFTVNGDDSLCVLGRDGNLWLERLGWQQSGRTQLDSNVDSFTINSTGNVLVHQSGGGILHVLGEILQFSITIPFKIIQAAGSAHHNETPNGNTSDGEEPAGGNGVEPSGNNSGPNSSTDLQPDGNSVPVGDNSWGMFIGNGCGGEDGIQFPSGNWLDCCDVHDGAYYFGGSGWDKFTADANLAACIAGHVPGEAGLVLGGAAFWGTTFVGGQYFNYSNPDSNRSSAHE